MHTLQTMLVEADSVEEAIAEVKSRTGLYGETSGPDWSDWHEVGGRWDGLFNGSNAMNYAENQALAEQVLEDAFARRKTSIEYLKNETREVSLESAIENYDPEAPVMDFRLYSLKLLAEVVMDYWTYESAVYDLVDGTASIKYFRKRLEENPEKQYWVAVDFHF